MKKSQLLFLAGWLGIANLAPAAQAQTLDAAFNRPSLYAGGLAYSATEQPDGKKVVTGAFIRVNGAATSSLVRLNANGTVDAAFQQNLGTASPVYRVALQSNGQLLLTSFTTTTPLTAGGISRNTILRLNADGTGDASFNAGTGTNTATSGSSVDFSLPLPNGQVLATGSFDSFNGVPANNIVRLTSTGGIDATFNPGSGPDDYISTSALLPSGKYLIAGYLTSYNGLSRNAIVRLNTDGSADTTFNPDLPTGSGIDNFTVQPDGRILVAGSFGLAGTSYTLLRLNADGTRDNTFTGNTTPIYSYYGNAVEVQADGKILVARRDGTTTLPVARLNSNGTPDASFAPSVTGFNFFSLTLLASGKLLVAGRAMALGNIPNSAVLQLNTNGSLDTSFQPSFQTTGAIANVVRQADGKLIASGSFSEVNGQAVNALVRFNADGTVDGTYTGTSALQNTPTDLALQPDGRLLVAYPTTVQRLLATGSNDNSFANSTLTMTGGSTNRLLLQPDGRILVGGQAPAANYPAIVRLQNNGTLDGSFSAALGAGTARMSIVRALALQPDGRIVVAGTYAPTTGPALSTVRRLESTGTFDLAYTGPTLLFNNSSTSSFVNSVALQADGAAVIGGLFNNIGSNVARLTTTGAQDASFAAPAFATGSVSKVLIQPNGRILLGGLFASSFLPSNLARVLSTGAADASYAATAVPNSTVRALLIQPDGGIVAGGSFNAVSGQLTAGLARIIASNVLAVQAPAAVAARTEAWPVPAHEQLNVQTDARAHAQTLDLVDVLGRVVRHADLRAGTSAATLRCDNLPAGTYLLRVSYAEGMVARRVQIQ